MNDEFNNENNMGEQQIGSADQMTQASNIAPAQTTEQNMSAAQAAEQINMSTAQTAEQVSTAQAENLQNNRTYTSCSDEENVPEHAPQEVNRNAFVMSNMNADPARNVETDAAAYANMYFTAPNNSLNETKKAKKEKKPNKRLRKFLKKSVALVSAAALFGAVAGVCFQGIQYLNKDNDSAVVQPTDELEAFSKNETNNKVSSVPTSNVVQTGTMNVTSTDVSDVVANVMPAIVAINCTATQTISDFFGREYDQEISGSGSGIIISQSNNEILIATNNHVVENAKAVEIVFADDSKAPATIKGTEPGSDLAVVSVNINDLEKETADHIRVATLGDSTQLKVGEMAIAIGNALGYGQSVTVGYVSALNRQLTLEDKTLNLIQTDAAINPGNSGGALINASGEIIGINSIKHSETSVEGIGYAIPISEAIPIINELMNREELNESEMAYLGIQGKNIDASYAKAFNMPVGVYVWSVTEGTAAEQAGLHKGDIIVGINGKTIASMDDLVNTLSYTRGGTKATLTLRILEKGEYVEKNVDVTLGFREEDK